jgi:Co/Zn/Cd efflux system component
MSSIFKFGEEVKGYNIRVLNEREIRAGAGLLFVFMFIAILSAIMQGSFTLLKYAVLIFLADMLI